MTGNIEIHPKQMVKNADKQNSAACFMAYVFSFMNENSPPNHPGMNISHTKHSITPIEMSVIHPKMTHRMKGMMSV